MEGLILGLGIPLGYIAMMAFTARMIVNYYVKKNGKFIKHAPYNTYNWTDAYTQTFWSSIFWPVVPLILIFRGIQSFALAPMIKQERIDKENAQTSRALWYELNKMVNEYNKDNSAVPLVLLEGVRDQINSLTRGKIELNERYNGTLETYANYDIRTDWEELNV